MDFWEGDVIKTIGTNDVFVFGSNPEGRHGAGAAKTAVKFGAVYGKGRGLYGNTYALITKNLTPGYVEKSTGTVYEKSGFRSVSKKQIVSNILELYICAYENLDKRFLITYRYEIWPNGTLKKSLNGYSSKEMFEMFLYEYIPPNIVFHDSYEKHFNILGI